MILIRVNRRVQGQFVKTVFNTGFVTGFEIQDRKMDCASLAHSTDIFLIREPGKYLSLENTRTREEATVFQLVST